MRPGDVQRYRLAASQSPLSNRLADIASAMESSADIDGIDVQLTVGRAVATFVQAIAPVVGPDNVSDFPRPSDFDYEPRRGSLFPALAVDSNSYTSTQLLLTFDDFGLLSAGAVCEYYPREALDVMIGPLSENMPSLAPYFTTVVTLLSRLSIKRLFDEIVTSYNIDKRSYDLHQVDFMRAQSMWFDARTPGFLECVRLLLFSEDSEWSTRAGQLAKLPEQIMLNRSLQLLPDEVDRLTWGLSGAAPLFRDDYIGFRTDIDWSLTSRAIRFVQSHNADSRVSRLVQIRGDLRRAVMETASGVDVGTVQRAILRNFLGLDLPQREVGPEAPGEWS